MRVTFVVPETTHHASTPSRERIRRVAEMLADRGHDVTVLCKPWWGTRGVDEFEQNDVVYSAITSTRGADRKYAMKLPVALRRTKPDVIHADGSAPGATATARYGAKLARAPLVGEWYDTDPSVGKGPKAVGGVDALVAPAETVRTRLREAGADAREVEVIPDTVDYERIRGVPPDDEFEDDVVYARRLDEGANLESLLLALAELRDYDWTTTVIGDGPRREEYEQQARELQIADRVRFVGEPDRDERVGIYRAARASVQTATHCVFPTELLWALACGCVGIVEYHADSSAHEVVENRERGFRVTTETELTDRIREAGDMEPKDCDEAFREYDREAVIERYLATYRDLLDERGLL